MSFTAKTFRQFLVSEEDPVHDGTRLLNENHVTILYIVITKFYRLLQITSIKR